MTLLNGITSKTLRRGLCTLMLVGAVGAVGASAVAADKTSRTSAPTPAAAPAGTAGGDGAAATAASANRIITFAQLGAASGMRLRGADASDSVNFGIRLDRSVSAASVVLHYTYSPALLPELSQLKVLVNQQLVATLPYDKANAGKPLTARIAVDPRLLSDFNQIELQTIAHYTAGCEDPLHSSMWTNISGNSEILLSTQPLALSNDLGILPAPFFDRRDNRLVDLPFVFGAMPSLPVAHAAGVVASWFGALADYRNARFPVLVNQLPNRHAVVFATNDTRPAALALPEVQGPTVRVMSSPQNPAVKLLVLQGRDAHDLEVDALALSSGSAALSGAVAQIAAITPPPPRKPYDAPRWVRTDRPVRFGDLVRDPADLQVHGYHPGPINIDLRVPADLMTWQNRGIPLDLKYRYTPPVKQDDSSLSVSINDRFVRAYRLRPSGTGGDASRMLLTLLSDNGTAQQSSLRLPAFEVGTNNRMSFQFLLQPQRAGACASGLSNGGAHAAIDADSTIDFSGMQHYAQMPNLGYFANSGFPFTKYADLAQTAIVLPEHPDVAEFEATFTVLGQLSKWTGVSAERFALVDAGHVDQVRDRDLLVIGSNDISKLLSSWDKHLPLLIEKGQRVMSHATDSGAVAYGRFWRVAQSALGTQGPRQLVVDASGPLAVLTGFESPFGKARSVVAITANQPADLSLATNALENDGQRLQMRGDLAVIRPDSTQSFRLGSTYDVGSVPFWTRLWFHLSNYPILLALAGVLAAIALAAALYGWLQQRAARRLEE